MQILHPFAGSVAEYLAQLDDPDQYRPDRCPQCQAKQPLAAHGFYSRTLIDSAFDGWIRVRRYLCEVCRRTVSLLPEFALNHELAIQGVMARIQKCGGKWPDTPQTALASRFAQHYECNSGSSPGGAHVRLFRPRSVACKTQESPGNRAIRCNNHGSVYEYCRPFSRGPSRAARRGCLLPAKSTSSITCSRYGGDIGGGTAIRRATRVGGVCKPMVSTCCCA